MLDEATLERLGHQWPGGTYPLASHVFPGLSPTVDPMLIRSGRDKDVELCCALASLAAGEQRDYLDLYLVDPADAKHWVSLPRWKRPIRKGDKADQHVWTFFRQYWINIKAHADGYTVNLIAQGTQLKTMAGSLFSIADPRRLALVLSLVGEALQKGEDLGDTTTKPWEQKR